MRQLLILLLLFFVLVTHGVSVKDSLGKIKEKVTAVVSAQSDLIQALADSVVEETCLVCAARAVSFSKQAMSMAVEYVELLGGIDSEKQLCEHVDDDVPFKTRAEAYLYLLGMEK